MRKNTGLWDPCSSANKRAPRCLRAGGRDNQKSPPGPYVKCCPKDRLTSIPGKAACVEHDARWGQGKWEEEKQQPTGPRSPFRRRSSSTSERPTYTLCVGVAQTLRTTLPVFCGERFGHWNLLGCQKVADNIKCIPLSWRHTWLNVQQQQLP